MGTVITLEDINVEKTNGKIRIDNTNADLEINASISNSPMNIKGKVKNETADLILNIPKFNPNFLIKDEEIALKELLPIVSIVGKYKGNVKEFDYNKLNATINLIESAPTKELNFSSGNIVIANNKIYMS